MKTEHKIIPEGINSSTENPLKEFALLTSGILVSLVVLFIILCFLAEAIAPFTPFRWEKKIFSTFESQDIEFTDQENPKEHQQITNYLRTLTGSIAEKQSLPEGIDISVHYIDTDVVNAFATLGGNIYVFRGLLEKMPNENALSWVIAHEIAHVKHRDPIKSLGRGALVGIVLTTVGISIGSDMLTDFFGLSGIITNLKFNREQEEEADIDALYTLQRMYGHVGSANEFFLQVGELQDQGSSKEIEFLSTHPLTENRMSKMQEINRKEGWKTKGDIISLPNEIMQLINKDASMPQ